MQKNIVRRSLSPLLIIFIIFLSLPFLLIFFVGIKTILFFETGGLSKCDAEIVQEVFSPHRSFVASLLEGSCGATTGKFYQVNMRYANEELESNELGIYEEGKVLQCAGLATVSISWKTEQQLTINGVRKTCQVLPNWKSIRITSSE